VEIGELTGRARLQEQATIAAVRRVREHYADEATIYVGGVPLITSDMVAFVKRDMAIFGAIILVLFVVVLYLFFRQIRWVLFPIGTTAVTVLLTAGVLAAIGQPITAVSANFVPLLAIICISFTVHLITRYRELYSEYRDHVKKCQLAYETMTSKLAPSVYTALTTGVAFASLLTADIVPVVDFGLTMCIGIVIAFITTYSFFASVLVLLPKNVANDEPRATPRLTTALARISTEYPGRVLIGSVVIAGLTFVGIQQLDLGNRLVKYFRGDTEIRQGLNFIDTRLGGTVPLDVIVQFEPFEAEAEEEGDVFDDFASEPDPFPERYWFTPEKIRVLDQLQAHMASSPYIGKEVSLANLERIARAFNDGEALNYVKLTAVLGLVPPDVRADLIRPYASPETGQMRISARLRETGPAYDLNEIIASIETYARDELALTDDEVRVTGVAVLFNDMLEQLVASQMSTLAFVILATFIMFLILMRSFTLALVGLLPNLLAAGVILAFMGFTGIPLDVITMTIAAIVIGIGVDDAIHYLHRLRDEIDAGRSMVEAVRNAHSSIGRAMYFTSLTVIIGFSVLAFSRFVPTVYFGLLAALAMVLALASNLTVLPALLIKLSQRRGEKVHV
ncbi:MAG: MMPL family transporter, partial [Pseudomonadota bacterium]